MRWIIDLTTALWLSSLTGTILFLIWYAVSRLSESTGRFNTIYALLRPVFLFWNLPLSFVVLQHLNYSRWGGMLFRYPQETERRLFFVSAIWLVGAGMLLFRYAWNAWRMHQKYRISLPIDDSVYDLFLETCGELGIGEGNVELVSDYRLKIPCLGGLLRTYVVLPDAEYTKEQLKLIFVHELTHYRQKSHVLRHLTEITTALHYANPLVWLFRNKVRCWEEYACDYEAVTRWKDCDGYFELIRGIAGTPSMAHVLNSYLCEQLPDIERRRKMIQRSDCMRKKSGWMTLTAVLTMVVFSTVGVSAATQAVGEGYYNAFVASAGAQEESAAEVPGVEYYADGFEPGVIVEQDQSGVSLLDIMGYAWTIKAHRAQCSHDFQASSGQTISVSCTVDNRDAQIRLGIIDPDNTLRYIVCSGAGAHVFTLTKTGNYSVYVHNLSDYEINVVVTSNLQ